MTPNAQHKRAERERRKAAGYKRVELWLSRDDLAWLQTMGPSLVDATEECVAYYRNKHSG